MYDQLDLIATKGALQALKHECLRRGVSKATWSRVDALIDVLPNIEHARQAQDRTNG